MKRASALAERAASLSLGLLAALNMLFLAAFALALAFGATRARAETPACTGVDLIAQMEADDPALLEHIRAEAAAVENAGALLWRIEAEGAEPSWLFGTMHVADPRVLTLPERVRAAFDAAGTVVIETTDILDQSKMMAALLARPELMMFTDDTTLFSLMSPQDREAAGAALAARGIPPASVARMKPWMIAAMVALPACELARKAAGAPVLDTMLAGEAKGAGKPVEGLESAIGQFEAMASLPMEFHISGLVETLKLGDRADDVIETMVSLYLAGETGMFWSFFRAALPSSDEDGGFAAFEEAMVKTRNRTMAQAARPFIDAGGAFLAVGALHLAGPDGLVALLREAGYSVEAVAAADEGDTPPVVGDDADEHGCRASAGYLWCEKTTRCERPWELAGSEGFENTPEAFREFCGG